MQLHRHNAHTRIVTSKHSSYSSLSFIRHNPHKYVNVTQKDNQDQRVKYNQNKRKNNNFT
jgi:hypothetical protein